MKRYALPLAFLLALAGCSSDDPANSPAASEGYPEGGQEALDAEASANAGENAALVDASETAEWDNGLTAKIASVTTGAASEYQNEQEGHDVTVQVTVEIANTGDAAFVFAENRYTGPGGARDDLYYGENLHDAQGWAGSVDGLDELPKQIVPGSSASYTGEWSLPSEGLEVLTFEFTPDNENLPTYTFTGVESLIA